MGRALSIRPTISCFTAPDASAGNASQCGSKSMPCPGLIAATARALPSNKIGAGGVQRLDPAIKPRDTPGKQHPAPYELQPTDTRQIGYRLRRSMPVTYIVWVPRWWAVSPKVSGKWSILTARSTSRIRKSTVTARLLPRRFCFDASNELFVVDETVEEVVPFVG